MSDSTRFTKDEMRAQAHRALEDCFNEIDEVLDVVVSVGGDRAGDDDGYHVCTLANVHSVRREFSLPTILTSIAQAILGEGYSVDLRSN